MTFSLGQIDEFRQDQLFMDAIFSSQVGAALVVLCVMLCMTKVEKRRTPVFIVNITNLLFVIIRGILFVHYFMGPLAKTYTTFTWDTSDVPMLEIIASVISSITSLLLMIGTQLSLLLQVRICYTLNPRSKTAILATCGAISSIATVAYIALGIYIIQLRDKPPDLNILKWANPTVNGMVALSIATYSGIFSWKMFQSVQNRRRMGFTGLGSLESLLISGFQCLFFPAIFCIVENFLKFGGSASLAQASVALVLPVSHLWATSVQTNSKLSISRIEKLQQHKPLWERVANLRNTRFEKLSNPFKNVIPAVENLLLMVWRRAERASWPAQESTGDTPQLRNPPSKVPDYVTKFPNVGSSSLISSCYSKDISGFGKDLESGRGS
ncbi:hypothetical protein ABW20_dc0109258 [Dactylellina cionopaga]|nr:hypothetical protein ABW20_dc0109258 [Dactylellina cionopaga]